jgi:hypothetical protein
MSRLSIISKDGSFFKPIASTGSKRRGGKEEPLRDHKQAGADDAWSKKISEYFFPGVPHHFPFKKKVMLSKSTSQGGQVWENFQLLITVIVCLLIILESYAESFESVRVLFWLEVVINQIFVVDFALSLYLQPSFFSLCASPSTWLDIATIAPVYVKIVLREDVEFWTGFLIYFLRLLRILRLFKCVRKMTGKNKHIAIFGLTIACMSFTFAGVFPEKELHY